METHVLLGAEEVGRAAATMSSAAQEMSRAAGYNDEAFRRHAQFMDDWLSRFEAVVERLERVKAGSEPALP